MRYSRSCSSLLATAFSTFLLITGCSSGGGGGTPTPQLPADAVTITDSNAMTVADSAVGTIAAVDAVRDAMGVEAGSLPSIQQAIGIVKDKVFDRERRSYQLATGVTGTEACYYSGSVSYSYSETATSASGSATFNNCDEGIVINGTVSFTSNWSNTTYDYTDTVNGSLTFTYGSESFTLVLDLDESGNESSGDYEETVSFSVTGIPGGGFLVTTEQTIVGDYYLNQVYSGQLLIQGANSTRLRITVVDTNYARVDLDNGSGSFSTVDYIYLTSY